MKNKLPYNIEEFEVKNTEVEKVMKEIGQLIAKELPEGWGFSLMIMDYGKNGCTFYISTVQREDMVKAMQEFIERNKK